MKRNRKVLSIILTLSLLVTLLLPLATPAAAATTYSALSVPTIAKTAAAPSAQDIGSILVSVDYLAAGTSKAAFSFPSSITLAQIAGAAPAAGGAPVTTFTYSGGAAATITANVYQLAADSYRLEVNTDVAVTDLKMTISGKVYTAGASGDISVMITDLGGQLTSGSVIVAKAGDGAVNVGMKTASDLAITTNTEVEFLVQETARGGMTADGGVSKPSMKFKLPAGFSWSTTAAHSYVANVGTSGSSALGTIGDGITATVYASDTRILEVYRTSTAANDKTVFKVVGRVTADESTAKYGDVVVNITGESDVNNDTVTIGKYAQYGATVTAKESKEILAGKKDQDVGGIYIEEAVPGSLVGSRSVTLKLPTGAKWEYNLDNSVTAPSVSVENSGDGALGTRSFPDEQTMKFIVTQSTKSTKFLIKNLKVRTAVDFSGDLNVEVAGTSTVTGTVKIADVKQRVTATSEGTIPDVVIGGANQAAADFTIVESKKEAIAKSTAAGTTNAMTINAPSGVEFDAVPKVEVVEGDFAIDTVTKSGGVVTISTDSTSSTPSKIKVSGIKLVVNRTVPEGPIKLTIKGDNVNATSANFANATTAASVIVANVVTPVPGEQKKAAKFVIGDTKFTVNGVEQTMDVAPYVKDGRTYLPVRFVAQALGVSDSNILWDEATQKVTLIKGDKVVQMTIGSKAMLVNGITINMDVPAEINSGRTMLPFRFMAQAFGASVGWDDATQTVTMDL